MAKRTRRPRRTSAARIVLTGPFMTTRSNPLETASPGARNLNKERILDLLTDEETTRANGVRLRLVRPLNDTAKGCLVGGGPGSLAAPDRVGSHSMGRSQTRAKDLPGTLAFSATRKAKGHVELRASANESGGSGKRLRGAPDDVARSGHRA